jgi:oligosaccharide repeat unit polymerase
MKYWWLNPTLVMVISNTVAVVVALRVSQSYYVELGKSTNGTVTAVHLWYLVPAIIALLVGGCLGTFIARHRPYTEAPRDRDSAMAGLTKVLVPMAVIVTAANIIWLVRGFQQGLSLSLIAAVLTAHFDAMSDIRGILIESTLPGITTLTQCVIIFCLIIGMVHRDRRLFKWRHHYTIAIVITLARALIMGERLSIIEIAIGFVIGSLWSSPDLSRARRFRVGVLYPLYAVVAVLVLFGTLEYFRSYQILRPTLENPNFIRYVFGRISAYYVFSLDNGASLYDRYGVLPIPILTMVWFWRFPGVMLLFPSYYSVEIKSLADGIYDSFVNPEYNTISSLFMAELDFGFVGGCVLLSLVAFASAFIYERCVRGSWRALFFFPGIYIGACESARIFYVFSGRAFAMFAAAGAVIWIASRHQRASRGMLDPQSNVSRLR